MVFTVTPFSPRLMKDEDNQRKDKDENAVHRLKNRNR